MEATMTDKPAVKLHNGKYTIESKQTGEHRTFWVRTQPVDAEFAPGHRVVMLLTGSQNDDPSCYTTFGFVNDDGIFVFPSKRPGPDCKTNNWIQFADLLWTLAIDGAFSSWAEKGFRIHLEGHCLRCNRVLTTPRSIQIGLGPICETL
jgi:hypothetical protein